MLKRKMPFPSTAVLTLMPVEIIKKLPSASENFSRNNVLLRLELLRYSRV